MRVLVAGTPYEENQITRALRKDYQCTVFWTDQESMRFTEEVEAIIAVTSSLSPKKLNYLKDLSQSKKIFLLKTPRGFSDIKNQFDNFLYERGKRLATQPAKAPSRPDAISRPVIQSVPAKKLFNSAMQEQLKFPQTPVTPPSKPIPTKAAPVEIPHDSGVGKKYSIEEREKIRKIIYECDQAGLTADDTLAFLEAEGVRAPNGDPYTKTKLSSAKQNISRLGWTPDISVMKEIWDAEEAAKKRKVSSQTSPVADVAPVPVPVVMAATSTEKLVSQSPVVAQSTTSSLLVVELLGQVLSSELDQAEKLNVIAKIQTGEITSLETTAVEVRDGKLHLINKKITAPKESNVDLALSKQECDMVLSNLAALNNFVTRGSL